jgi:two-component system chemotaxis response regulator CheY
MSVTMQSVKLPASLDLASAGELAASWRSALQGGQRVAVDASGVEQITLAGVQVMMAAAKNPEVFAIENPSEQFVGGFRDCGLDWSAIYVPAPALVPEPAAADLAQDPGPAPAEDAAAPMAKRIMTIDDSKTMRDMLMITLANAGFEVFQAVDGQAGVDALRDQEVDLIITDINMPRMDGYQVIKELRGRPEHQTTPILVLTTESEGTKRTAARDLGATGWLVKPFDPERLIETVNKVCP